MRRLLSKLLFWRKCRTLLFQHISVRPEPIHLMVGYSERPGDGFQEFVMRPDSAITIVTSGGSVQIWETI